MDRATFEGQVALVTGASRGIGKAIALGLACHGARVALAARSQEALEKVAQEASASGAAESGAPRACVFPVDLANEDAPDRLVSDVVATMGGLDIVVSNAGAAASAPVVETTLEQWDRLMAVNARAAFLLCKAAIPHLARRAGGRIVLVTSVVGTQGYAHQAAYAASKHALMGFAKVLAKEVHPMGIRVHVVAPGGVDTDLVSVMRPDLDRTGLIAAEEIAETVLFLLAQRGNAVIDEVNIRRAGKIPWS